jgi:hypothetical protein
VSASPVHSNPIPLSFLCPSVDGEDDLDCSLSARASLSAGHSAAPAKSPSVLAARRIPDRFSKEADGVWRRVDSYTLYGSTMPSCASGTCTKPTGVPSSVDDQIKGPDSPVNVTASTKSTLTLDDLPPGWKPSAKPSGDRTPLILAVSLVLAFFICSTIIGCIFWRKKVKASKDPERARKKKRRGEEEESKALVEKEMKVKQKIWARATAKWKANVRHSARLRRRISRISQAHQSSISFDNSQNYLSPSLTQSRSSSRSSTDRVPVHQHPTEHPENPLQPTSGELSMQVAISPALPPAYQHGGQIPAMVVSLDDMSAQACSGLSLSAVHDHSPRPSHSSIAEASGLNGQHPVALLSAHVATDDKQFLARLANMASAPPSDEALVPGDLPGSVQALVPTWHDEDIDDFETCLAPHKSLPSAESSFSAPMFPPPPSKERLASAEAFDYPYTFDDLETPDLEPSEPSAPPFEEGSAPSAPSAPPLPEDGDTDPQPSAPEWNSLSLNEMREETPGGQDHEWIPTASGPPSTLIATAPSMRDSIVLPVYRP